MKTRLYIFSMTTTHFDVPVFSCVDKVKFQTKRKRDDYFYKCYPSIPQYRRTLLIRACKNCASELLLTLNTRTGAV